MLSSPRKVWIFLLLGLLGQSCLEKPSSVTQPAAKSNAPTLVASSPIGPPGPTSNPPVVPTPGPIPNPPAPANIPFGSSGWQSFSSTSLVNGAQLADNVVTAAVLGVANQKILGVGTFYQSGYSGIFMARYLENGDLDATFGMGGTIKFTQDSSGSNPKYIVKGALIQSNGRIVIWGSRYQSLFVAGFTAEGMLDNTFGEYRSGFLAQTFPSNTLARAVTSQADGKLVVLGNYLQTGFPAGGFVIRLSENGILESGFGTPTQYGTVPLESISSPTLLDYPAIAVAKDGSIYVVGSGQGTHPQQGYGLFGILHKFSARGLVDPQFGGAGYQVARAVQFSGVALQSDGKIVALGSRVNGNSGTGESSSATLTRILPDGSFDVSFSIDNGTRIYILDSSRTARPDTVLIDSAQRIVFFGRHGVGSSPTCQLYGMRLLTDGNGDSSFGMGGWWTTLNQGPCNTAAASILSNGKIALTGPGPAYDSSPGVLFVERLKANGTLDR